MNHPETGQHLPLVPPVSQFDGGPHASENCAAASMARLRRYMTGVPTTGTQVRVNQSDQVGGISIPDALCALRRMAPIVRPNWAAPYDTTAKPNPINRISGATTSAGIIHLLEEGYMVVMQGDYGNLPVEWREQKTFTGDHAFTLDAVFGTTSTRAGYVVDTIPHYGTGYQGRVIPWTALMQYAYGLAGNGRIYAAWGKPPAPPKPPTEKWEAVIHPKPGDADGKQPFLVYRVRDHDDRPLQILEHQTTQTGGSTYNVSPPIKAVRGPGFPKDAYLPKGLCRLLSAVPHLPGGGYLDVALCKRVS